MGYHKVFSCNYFLLFGSKSKVEHEITFLNRRRMLNRFATRSFLRQLELSSGELEYYKLKQTDFDGAFDYSGIVSLTCNANWTSSFVNPITYSKISGVILSPVITNARLQLLSANGQIVAEKQYELGQGANLIELENLDLQEGIYILRISATDQLFTHKLIVID
jgi:hypothetical protein